MIPGMLQVGLTGNIASGKSNAARVFTELGAHVIDADAIAHELMSPGHETYEKVVLAFGRGVLNTDATINRKVLGEIVFSREDKRLLLNSLVHPDVRAEIERRIGADAAASPHAVIIIDAALMVETGYYRQLQALVVVTCSPSLQLARLIHRDGLSLEEARARVSSQMPAEEKLKLATYAIETSGTLRETRGQIETVYRHLVRLERELSGEPTPQA